VELVTRWRQLLETLGTVSHFGELGAGAAAKLVVNSTLGALMTALGEALALGDSLGLDRGQVLDLLAESPIGVTAKRKRDNILSDRYEPNFKLALAAKDMRLVMEAAQQNGAQLKVAEAARSWLEDAADAGLGDLDYSAVIRLITSR
jgi:3-hydroxyisobutyrate dehydrogenase-like beta-hydroxyacid dehydrogenase